ncbi:PRTRC system ThiF family protein [Geomonas subterranea]|uniref:PRTRC system ThiF family protein n=1 Tax=Geomonas subterranea TaxID=2847989 RepID=UPI001CD2C5BD|nr:PRTRC system ThiF family protein [Geomonas fuzhouensis]
MRHHIQSHLLRGTVEVALVGCGGNGSIMLTELTKIDKAMRELGHPGGLHVTVFDPDTVSESNIGRQNFYAPDRGLNKAVVLVDRVNKCCGVDWKAVPDYFPPKDEQGRYYRPDIIIGCVDTRKARRQIAAYASRASYWLDLGNGLSTGQVILGEPLRVSEIPSTRPMRLPTVVDLYPDLLDESIPEDDIPTCSLAEALERQDLFVCRSVVTFAANLLWNLFRKGGVDNHGHFINLDSGMVTALPVDPEVWARFKPLPAKKPRKKRTTSPSK